MISQLQLEKYLWDAANVLRGRMDAADFKVFIFPLLFFKRICDVYDEEFATALEDSENDVEYANFAENHRFQVPDEAHWKKIRTTSRDVGTAIQMALQRLEQANPAYLMGVFGDARWTNKDRLPDDLLRNLIEHFSGIDLSISNVPADELGLAYEYLIKKFADDSGHTAAEFYTNRTVVHLMTEITDPQPGESIYDPTCGSGGMLLNAVLHVAQSSKEHRSMRLYGQELNLITSAIARMNLFLHGIEDFDIQRGDTLSAPMFLQQDRLRKFDVVLANPPYSIKRWNHSAWKSDPYGRNLFGTPPASCADYAFIQHILCSLSNEKGRAAILLPHGILFRDSELNIRKGIIENGSIECVIGLGANLFYNSPMEACILVFRKERRKKKCNGILFIDGSADIRHERGASYLEDLHIERILDAYNSWGTIPNLARLVEIGEIISNDYNLNIPLYVERIRENGPASETQQPLSRILSDFHQCFNSLTEQHAQLQRTFLKELTDED